MSVTTSIPELVEQDGGIATAEELEILWTALADLEEELLGRLFQRTVNVLIDAYETPSKHPEWPKIDVDHELVSHWTYWTGYIVGTCETMLDKARKMERLTQSLAHAAQENGNVSEDPPFGRYGGEYVPSPEVMEQWGLVKPKADDAR